MADSVVVAITETVDDVAVAITVTTQDVAIGILAAGREYADNAAALTAGLVIGDLYRTGDAVKVVHA